MAKAPSPVRDLDWSPERAEKMGIGAVALWKELLVGLASSLPVARRWKDANVTQKLALAVPDEPLSEAALTGHIRQVMFDFSMYPGHRRFMAFITGAGTIPGAVADLLAAGLNQNVG